MTGSSPSGTSDGTGLVQLRLLATTDLHAHLLAYDYYRDRPSEDVGLVRAASLIEAARADAANTLLLDNGDFLHGSPLGDMVAGSCGWDDTHPVIAAMNALRYDAATLGNHEFNYGLPFLQTALAGAAFPIVSANVLDAGTGQPLYRQDCVLEKDVTDVAGKTHRLRIGVTGFCPPQIAVWDRHHLKGRVTVQGILSTAERILPALREAGADLIVVLCHSGISTEVPDDQMENAALALAALPGVDAMFAGHHHLVFPGDGYPKMEGVDRTSGRLHGVPTVMAGAYGSHLGVIDLIVRHFDGAWSVGESHVETRSIAWRDGATVRARVTDHLQTAACVAKAHAHTLAQIRTPVGATERPLQSFFSLVSEAPAVAIVAHAQRWYVAQQLARTEWATLPILSAAAPFKAGGRGGPDHYTNIPAGPVAKKDVASLYLFPNTVHVVAVTGATVLQWLERSAALFHQVLPGTQDAELLDPEFPCYNFDSIDGVRYRIDLSVPGLYDRDGRRVGSGRGRIRDLCFEGRPIDPTARFLVATNSYRASGGGDFPGIDGSATVFAATDTNRDVVERFLRAGKTLSPSWSPSWIFEPLADTTAVFPGGPAGEAHAADVPGVRISRLGDAPDGFALYRVAF